MTTEAIHLNFKMNSNIQRVTSDDAKVNSQRQRINRTREHNCLRKHFKSIPLSVPRGASAIRLGITSPLRVSDARKTRRRAIAAAQSAKAEVISRLNSGGRRRRDEYKLSSKHIETLDCTTSWYIRYPRNLLL